MTRSDAMVDVPFTEDDTARKRRKEKKKEMLQNYGVYHHGNRQSQVECASEGTKAQRQRQQQHAEDNRITPYSCGRLKEPLTAELWRPQPVLKGTVHRQEHIAAVFQTRLEEGSPRGHGGKLCLCCGFDQQVAEGKKFALLLTRSHSLRYTWLKPL
ncbi:hypothetical protein EYF80_014661 [Liparis tanakae]|uniref:Uncharacterized protein n=1 Tax=Liparis tanakae TaxID=230148 RepID=A0A4Z2IAR5_9TELE|nr:hypothetical protein EYF80_014661 [Liparis tanakae]